MRGRGGLHRIVVFSWNLGPHTRQHSWAPGCFATLVVCSLVMCFYFTRQSATTKQEHRKKDKLRSKESRKIGKSAQKRADEQRNISGHLNANRHGRHVAESGAILRDKISSGFTVKIAVHPIKKYYVYPRRKFQ